MVVNKINKITGEATGTDITLALQNELAALRRENKQLSISLQLKNAYIYDKVNHLLDVMGTKPLREEELDGDSIIEIDPLGIIFESFRHILASLKDKNSQLQMLHDETVAIFAAAQVGIMVVDSDLGIISCNDKMKEIFFSGLEQEAIIGACCRDIACKREIEDQYCAASKIFAGANIASFKGWEVRGHVFDVEAAPIHDADGVIKRVVLVYNDITDLKKTQNELGELNSALEQRVEERTALYQEVNRELESFCYSISHDLRAPLRHINGFTAILEEDYQNSLDETGREYLQRICAVSEKMGRMIDELLQISRVSRATLNFVAVDLSNLAETATAMFREAEPSRRVQIDIAPGLTAYGDATLLGMVMQNLIGNAWKYTSQNSDALIEFGRTRTSGRDVFFVRDNGVGFDMAYKGKLFGVFERLHGEEFEGSGIGLATVQRIISRHQGEIWAEGEVGRGATFFFSLP